MNEKRGERKGRTMVLDPIILPLSHLCFAPPNGREMRNGRTVVIMISHISTVKLSRYYAS